MNISILCTDAGHPVVPRLQEWRTRTAAQGHDVALCFDKKELLGGDILFLVSCSQLMREEETSKYRSVLVLHASDLPRGRGWSPHIWAIINGANQISVSILEAAEPVDSGPVWRKTSFQLEGHELLPEINAKLFDCELDLMSKALELAGKISPTPQRGEAGAYMQKRTPDHSRLDPHKTIAEQFDLLRVVDNQRYPAFFEYRGHRYLLRIEKAKDA